jgi:hypothetical protein
MDSVCYPNLYFKIEDAWLHIEKDLDGFFYIHNKGLMHIRDVIINPDEMQVSICYKEVYDNCYRYLDWKIVSRNVV